jgi:hypothetical protein
LSRYGQFNVPQADEKRFANAGLVLEVVTARKAEKQTCQVAPFHLAALRRRQPPAPYSNAGEQHATVICAYGAGRRRDRSRRLSELAAARPVA